MRTNQNKTKITKNKKLPLLLVFVAFAMTLLPVSVYGSNSKPIVRIDEPKMGEKFDPSHKIYFKGSATDAEDGLLPSRCLVWTSDIDGFIGEGNNFSKILSPGSHIIILTATDLTNNSGKASVFVRVELPPQPESNEPKHLVNKEIVSEEGRPSIEFTYVPRMGSYNDLSGVVKNVNPESCFVVVYIEVNGTWWTKPYWDSRLIGINDDGSWTCDITTGGIDENSTKIVAYLIPKTYVPPLASGAPMLSQKLDKSSIAKVVATRELQYLRKKNEIPTKVNDEITLLIKKINGACYGPFRDNQDPDLGVYPTKKELEEDLAFIPSITQSIRTYGCINSLARISEICEKNKLDCYIGAWLGEYEIENNKEIESLISIANNNFDRVKGLIVGNEVLLRKDMTEDELIEAIRKVRASTDIPITTAEIWSIWSKHPRLIGEIDFLMVHIHPYWEGIKINDAARHVIKVYKYLKAVYPSKRIVIGETGWPSDGKIVGEAVPNKENQERFFREFVSLAEAENIEYFYFEIFDEEWKDKFEGKAGAHWGYFESNGSVKKHMSGVVSMSVRNSLHRPPGEPQKIKLNAPVFIYKDGGSPENRFHPSGMMGDIDKIVVNRTCRINPQSGSTCIRIDYIPGGFGAGWSGVYWQFPINNWGKCPGYEIIGAEKITFWARGEKGGEASEFKTGGIRDWSLKTKYNDSYGPITTGVVRLSKEWNQYSIDLRGADISNVIGGFCWVSNRPQNLSGCTIYVDNIQFE